MTKSKQSGSIMSNEIHCKVFQVITVQLYCCHSDHSHIADLVNQVNLLLAGIATIPL